MIVFLRNIPDKTKNSDIIAFVEPAMKVRWFAKKGVIENIKILQLKDSRTKNSEYHGLVTINSDVIAEKVIKRLNRKIFLGKHIAVRRFLRRNWDNDPRGNYRVKPSLNSEKRASDRRRMQMEEVADMSHNFSSNREFYRQYK